jgi:hypothetical protein
MNQRIPAELIKQAEDVIHGETALASMDQLDGAPGLQIDARNQHVKSITPIGERKWNVHRDIV